MKYFKFSILLGKKLDIIESPKRLDELKKKLGCNSNLKNKKEELTNEELASLRFEEMSSLCRFAKLIDGERDIKIVRKPMFYGSDDFQEISSERVKELLVRIS